MAEFKFYKQEMSYTCGPAVMRMALNFCGISKSEKQLVKLMGTNKIRGTWHKSFPIVAEKYKLCYVAGRKNSTIKELKNLMNEGYIVVVSYYLPDEKIGHYAVVKKITADCIYLLDPWYGDNIKYSLKLFSTKWHDLMKKYDREKRWFFAVKK